MKIAIETKDSRVKYFKIDGRNLRKFLKKVKEVNGGIKAAWTYTNIEILPNSSIGTFINTKDIKL